MRYKEFNTNNVLEKCIFLFWEHGFSSCSINDIVKKTHVNRFSLYNEFENKDTILLSALNLYKERYSNKRIAILNQNKPLREVLKEFYFSYLTEDDKHPPGCFIIHISTELADDNEIIKNKLDAYLLEIEEKIGTLLNKYDETKKQRKFSAKHLTGLFCNSMCFCLIQSPKEQRIYIENGLNLILSKTYTNGKNFR